MKLGFKPIVTYVLVLINIAVFIFMSIFGGTYDINNLITFGANYQPLVLSGQWYRLVTAMFIHIGLQHLLLNMLTLYFCGVFLEKIFGHFKFLIIYLLAGIGGNLLSIAFAPDVVSAGASTSIFGMFGMFIMMGVAFPNSNYFKTIKNQFLMFVLLNFVFALLPNSGIDIYGHLGGLIVGFLTALVISLPKSGDKLIIKKYLLGFIGLILYLIIVFIKLFS